MQAERMHMLAEKLDMEGTCLDEREKELLRVGLIGKLKEIQHEQMSYYMMGDRTGVKDLQQHIDKLFDYSFGS